MATNQVSEFYETDSEIYDQRWEKAGGEATSKAQQAVVSSFIKDWTGKDVLEVGCGSGRFSVLIAQKTSAAFFLDLTTGMLKVTRKKFASTSKEFRGINASVYNIPLPANSRDAVISINVFNHIDRPQDALREIHRVLKPGGKLLVNFTNLYSYYLPMAVLINNSHKSIGRDVYSVWSKPGEVKQILNGLGFTITETAGNVFVPLNLDKPVIRNIPLALDKVSRNSLLKWLAPNLFFYCEKR